MGPVGHGGQGSEVLLPVLQGEDDESRGNRELNVKMMAGLIKDYGLNITM